MRLLFVLTRLYWCEAWLERSCSGNQGRWHRGPNPGLSVAMKSHRTSLTNHSDYKSQLSWSARQSGSRCTTVFACGLTLFGSSVCCSAARPSAAAAAVTQCHVTATASWVERTRASSRARTDNRERHVLVGLARENVIGIVLCLRRLGQLYIGGWPNRKWRSCRRRFSPHSICPAYEKSMHRISLYSRLNTSVPIKATLERDVGVLPCATAPCLGLGCIFI